jgi:hypothetical protein
VVAVSYFRTAADADHLLDRLHTGGADDLDLVLKIETRQGFDNLPATRLIAHASPARRRHDRPRRPGLWI